jgi:hypothetical protein
MKRKVIFLYLFVLLATQTFAHNFFGGYVMGSLAYTNNIAGMVQGEKTWSLLTGGHIGTDYIFNSESFRATLDLGYTGHSYNANLLLSGQFQVKLGDIPNYTGLLFGYNFLNNPISKRDGLTAGIVSTTIIPLNSYLAILPQLKMNLNMTTTFHIELGVGLRLNITDITAN